MINGNFPIYNFLFVPVGAHKLWRTKQCTFKSLRCTWTHHEVLVPVCCFPTLTLNVTKTRWRLSACFFFFFTSQLLWFKHLITSVAGSLWRFMSQTEKSTSICCSAGVKRHIQGKRGRTYIKREHLLYDHHQISSRFFLKSHHRCFFSVLQIQTDYSKQIRWRPVLSAPLELNKPLIMDGHQVLDRRAVFAVGECTHGLLRMGRERREVTPAGFFVLFSLDDASSVHFSYFNWLRGSFHWGTLPTLSKKTCKVLPHHRNRVQ